MKNFYRRFYLKQNIYIIDKTNTISGKDILLDFYLDFLHQLFFF